MLASVKLELCCLAPMQKACRGAAGTSLPTLTTSSTRLVDAKDTWFTTHARLLGWRKENTTYCTYASTHLHCACKRAKFDCTSRYPITILCMPPGRQEACGVLFAAQDPFPRGGFASAHASQPQAGVGAADSQGIVLLQNQTPMIDRARLGPTVRREANCTRNCSVWARSAEHRMGRDDTLPKN